MIAALKAVGGNPKYTEVKGGGHTIWDKIYDEHDDALYDWLFDQHLGGSAVSAGTHVAPVALADPIAIPAAASYIIDASVPEPGTLGVTALAAIAALARRTRRVKIPLNVTSP
jgi:hypothetical protein